MRLHIAITGASGSIYAFRLLTRLSASALVSRIYVTLTSTASSVVDLELGEGSVASLGSLDKVVVLDNSSYFTSVASGSSAPDAMVVVPCSMGMLARVAMGVSTDLVSRSADVMLKEERRLIVVPRETPLSLIHLENMVRLKKAGATILPATPSFYSGVQSVEALVDSVVDRIMDHLKIPDTQYRWMGDLH